jgi:hypothetical protein
MTVTNDEVISSSHDSNMQRRAAGEAVLVLELWWA